MALKECRECKKEVSSGATKCPHCGATSPAATKEVLLLSWAVVLSIVIFPFWYLYDSIDIEPVQTNNVPISQRIEGFAIDTMSIDQYPNIYKTWGKERVDWLNSLQRPLAHYTLTKYSCDVITSMALSTSRSTPPNFAMFFVDCKNGNRYYVSSYDLE